MNWSLDSLLCMASPLAVYFLLVLSVLVVAHGMMHIHSFNELKKRNKVAAKYFRDADLHLQRFYNLPIDAGNGVLSKDQHTRIHLAREALVVAWYELHGWTPPIRIRRRKQAPNRESVFDPHDYSTGSKPARDQAYYDSDRMQAALNIERESH